MVEELSGPSRVLNCIHGKYREFTQKSFDILNGYEIQAVRCSNCYKILELSIRKMTCGNMPR